MLEQEPKKAHRTKSEKMAKTTKRRRGTRPKSNAQLICDSRDESTDKEKRNNDQPHTDRAKSQHRRPRLETDRDELREEREMQDECRRWNAQTEASQITETRFSELTYEVGGRSRRRGSHGG